MAVNFEVSKLLERYGKILSEKQQRILDSYYNCDLSLSEIAENEGMTRQGASDFVRRSVSSLYDFEDKLSFCKKIDLLKEMFDDFRNDKSDLSVLADFIDNF